MRIVLIDDNDEEIFSEDVAYIKQIESSFNATGVGDYIITEIIEAERMGYK